MEQTTATEVFHFLLPAKGDFPNNDTLPVLLYKRVLLPLEKKPEKKVKKIFKKNDWRNSWIDGIYDYHHYHSNVHEVLGILSGEAHIMIGGPSGAKIHLEQGDILIIPAGVAHKYLSGSKDFSCIGAYPEGKDYDMKYGHEDELPYAIQNIRKVPLPENDPVFGSEGSLKHYWKNTPTVKMVTGVINQ